MNAPVPELRPISSLAPAAAADGRDLIDFTRFFAMLWRGRLGLALAAFGAAALAGAWSVLLAEPRFQSTAVLVMAPAEAAMPTGLETLVPGFGSGSVAANTEVEILRSRTLLAQLVARLGLAETAEFNPALAQPGPAARAKATLRRLVGIAPAPPAPGATALDLLAQRMTVRNVPDTRVFEITVESRDPARAALIANTLAALYLEAQVRQKQDDAARAAGWLAARVDDLRDELERAEARARAFAASAGLTDAAALQALSSEVERLRQDILTRQADLSARGLSETAVAAQLAPLRAAEAGMASRLARQSEAQMRFGQLQLEAQSSRVIYEGFLARLKDARVQSDIQAADSRILSAAEPAGTPTRPRPALAALLAGFLGSIAAAIRLLAVAARDETVFSAADLEAAGAAPVLGCLPRSRQLARNAARNPRGRTAAAVEALRIALHLAGPGVFPALLVTSARPGDGKSGVARALARSLGRAGHRVLLIEAGIVAAPPSPPPLILALAGKLPLAAAVRKDTALAADVLAGGLPAQAAGRILSGGRFGPLLRVARAQYGCVVIDGPALLAWPDTRALGATTGAVLCVAAAGRTTRADLASVRGALAVTGLAPAGYALTGANASDLRRAPSPTQPAPCRALPDLPRRLALRR